MTDLDNLPCSNDPNAECKTCNLHGNGCPVEMPYNVVKAVYPIKTMSKAGVDVRELVIKNHREYYEKLKLNSFDWENIDGVLDYLYGERQKGLMCGLMGIKKENITEIINLIESNCEVALK